MLSLFQGQSVNSVIKMQPDLFVCQNTFISLLICGYNLTGESKTFLSLSKKSFTRSLRLFSAQCANRQRFRSWPESGSLQLHRSGAVRASPCTCKNTDWEWFPCSPLSGKAVGLFLPHVNPPGIEEGGMLPPWSEKLSHRRGQGIELARKTALGSAHSSQLLLGWGITSNCWPHVPSLQWRHQTAYATYIPGDLSHYHVVEFPWKPVFLPGKTLAAFLVLTPLSSPDHSASL